MNHARTHQQKKPVAVHFLTMNCDHFISLGNFRIAHKRRGEKRDGYSDYIYYLKKKNAVKKLIRLKNFVLSTVGLLEHTPFAHSVTFIPFNK